jgi:hypothetical protein
MNEWKESDWFKMWLALARKSPELMVSIRDDSAELAPKNRQNSQGTKNWEQTPAPEWEVTE